MKSNKSCGPNNIPVTVYKNLAHSICRPLCEIFNLSLSSSSVPTVWKQAIVTPIFKKGSSNDPSNYRPISLTSTACKILESIVKDCVLTHLLANDVLSPHQYGFLAKKSTTCQLLDCCVDWMHNMSLKKHTDIIYLNFAKAFDSVVHSKLLYKLK